MEGVLSRDSRTSSERTQGGAGGRGGMRRAIPAAATARAIFLLGVMVAARTDVGRRRAGRVAPDLKTPRLENGGAAAADRLPPAVIEPHPSVCSAGVICVPSDVDDVDAAIEMVPGFGDAIAFDAARHVLDECAIVRWGMRLQMSGTHGHGAERAEVWGNWTLLQSTSGTWDNLKLGLHAYLSQFSLLDIRGGPWEFTSCDVRCIGGVAAELVLRAKLIMTHCGLGGIDSQYMRAQDALICRMDSAADLLDCTLELCGVLRGHGVHLLEEARASLQQCHLLDNAVGVCAEGNTCIALSECRLAGNKWAAFHCGASANLVTWCLDACRITARCGFVWLTNRRPAILRTRRLQVTHCEPDQEALLPRQGRLEDFNQHPKAHASLSRRRAQRSRSYTVCQCPTCQKPNEALRKAAQARAHARLLKVQRQTHNPDVIVATARSIFPAPSMSAAAVGEDLSEISSTGDTSSADGSSVLADLDFAIGNPEEYFKTVPSSVDLSIWGAKVSQRPRVSRPYDRPSDPSQEAKARAMAAEAKAKPEDWEQVSWPDVASARAAYRQFRKGGLLPTGALADLMNDKLYDTDADASSRHKTGGPRLPGNLAMFQTAPRETLLENEESSSHSAPTTDNGQRGHANSPTHVGISPAAEALATHSIDDIKLQEHAHRLGSTEMSVEETFQYLRIAAEGLRKNGNVTAALCREFPRDFGPESAGTIGDKSDGVDLGQASRRPETSAPVELETGGDERSASKSVSADVPEIAGAKEATSPGAPRVPPQGKLVQEGIEAGPACDSDIFGSSSEIQEWPSSSDVALHDFLRKTGAL